LLNQQQTRLIDPILSSIAFGYRNGAMVGDHLFPRIPVPISGGTIIQFGKEAFKAYNSLRAPGGATKRIDFGYAGAKYALVEDALEAKVPFERQRDARLVPGIDIASSAVKLILSVQSLALEVSQATLATTAANYDNAHKVALAGTDKWSNAAGDPGVQMRSYREAVRASIGIYPNVLVLGAAAFNAAAENPIVKDRFKYTSHESVTAEMLAGYFNVKKVVVGEAVVSDDAGNMSDVWGNNGVLAYVPESASNQEEPSYGYTYVMEGHPMVEEPYQERNAKSWIYPVTFERQALQTAILSGFLIQNPA
jgi:hypothetical protein